jgi:hypothetical protein
MTLPLSPALRRRMALWLCPELAVPVAITAVAPITAPVFHGRIRPYWWRNEPLRDFLTGSHRQLTLEETRAEAVKRFGDGVPSISAIHRYWTRLDKLKAAQGPQFTEFLTQTEANDG